MGSSGRKMLTRENRIGWFFVLISTAFIVIFIFYPMVQAFITSMYQGIGAKEHFVGLDNYRHMMVDARFKQATLNTLLYLVIQVPVMLILALVISVLLNNKRIRAKGFFRTAIFLPCITSLVAYSLVMKSLFSPDGVVNDLLMNLHLIAEPIDWFTDSVWAKVMLIFSITWRWTGYNMIFYLAGLQNIDPAIYEAAEIDGTSPIKQLFTITIPLLKPIILFTTITSTIGTLQLFDEVRNITNGGPAGGTATIAHYIYNTSFSTGSPDFGYAAAMSLAILFGIVVLSIIQMRIGRDKRDA